MIFDSIEFAVFLPIVFVLYWFAANKNLSIQNILLLAASYFFYAFWDWRFLFLLVFISLMNYAFGLIIQKYDNSKIKKKWFITGIAANILALSYFKYFDFFIDNFILLFSKSGLTLHKPTLNILLPIGISFYIFLSLSYIIDVYRNNLKACKNVIELLLALSFFPIILAGPIQRPIKLLSQIQKPRIFNYDFAVAGLKQILWGLFMKIVIADKCAVFVNNIFQNFSNYNSSTLLMGGIYYTVQIYADFAGYSLIAIGVSKLFGFELMRNFNYPYFSRDIKEFWQKWHISLTTWFRDYVFLPVAYLLTRKISKEKLLFFKKDIFIYIIGVSITWFLTGFWHGGNYTFIVWGFLNGFFLILYQVLNKPGRKLFGKLNIKNNSLLVVSIERLFTLFIIIISWIIFRSENIGQALNYLSRMFSKSLLNFPNYPDKMELIISIILILIFFSIEWFGRKQDFAIAKFSSRFNKPIRWAFYYILILSIIYFSGSNQEFIYFKF